MKSTIKILLTNILVFSMLGIIVNMSLPNGSFKKYSKFLINIAMVTMILKPFLNIDSANLLEQSMWQNYASTGTREVEIKSKSIERAQRQQIKELFKKKVENQIEMQIMSIMECENVVVTVRLDDMSDNIHNITHIHIRVRETSIKNSQIEIGIKSNEGKSDEIVSYLSSLYNIPEENITIESYN